MLGRGTQAQREWGRVWEKESGCLSVRVRPPAPTTATTGCPAAVSPASHSRLRQQQ